MSGELRAMSVESLPMWTRLRQDMRVAMAGQSFYGKDYGYGRYAYGNGRGDVRAVTVGRLQRGAEIMQA